MSISLYEISIASFDQALGSVSHFLKKAREHFEQNNLDPDTMLTQCVTDDMLPFTFQLNSVRHHSLGAIEGILAGEFSPPPSLPEMDYSDFQSFISEAHQKLQTYEREEINSALGKAVIFKLGESQIPFTAENFVMSFSLPNLYFHVTTAYGLLRKEGVPLGKRDYMGRLRMTKP